VRDVTTVREQEPAAVLHPVDVVGVERRFGAKVALRDVSLRIESGRIHALLGPNGAGKTTLLRVLTGLVEPDDGDVRLMGIPWSPADARRIRRLFGFVPSGDRTFYLRLTGMENLVFFARMYGLGRREAVARAQQVLASVELEDAADVTVGVYSHGMQKRLSLARALLLSPPILFIDEATHDLDPEGARRVQDLVAAAAMRGTAVIWATQRLDEIRGFANRVTLIDRGRIRFSGSVPQLMAMHAARRYVLHIANGDLGAARLVAAARSALGQMGTIVRNDDSGGDHYLMSLRDEAVFGDALGALVAAGLKILACQEERSSIENAFLHLTAEDSS
jgi:ABC-2 type transport system ATP-binding protein